MPLLPTVPLAADVRVDVLVRLPLWHVRHGTGEAIDPLLRRPRAPLHAYGVSDDCQVELVARLKTRYADRKDFVEKEVDDWVAQIETPKQTH